MLYFVAAPSHLNFEFCHWLLCCLSHLMRFMALPTTQLLLLQELRQWLNSWYDFVLLE